MLISVKGKIRGEIEEKLISANGWRRGRLTNGPIFARWIGEKYRFFFPSSRSEGNCWCSRERYNFCCFSSIEKARFFPLDRLSSSVIINAFQSLERKRRWRYRDGRRRYPSIGLPASSRVAINQKIYGKVKAVVIWPVTVSRIFTSIHVNTSLSKPFRVFLEGSTTGTPCFAASIKFQRDNYGEPSDAPSRHLGAELF